ncbi:MAG: SymE family type I addiction module toxin [Stenotrophomonas sp.]|uniref:SymE family type I addiction module toxin n=1 Tax=Stenotrophomonas sp. TaxID=69392 RepID=UPI002FCA2AB4
MHVSDQTTALPILDDDAQDTPAPRRRPYARIPRSCTVSCAYYEAPGTEGEKVPKLRLQGRWLAQLGFLNGELVRITARQGELVISATGVKAYTTPVRNRLA